MEEDTKEPTDFNQFTTEWFEPEELLKAVIKKKQEEQSQKANTQTTKKHTPYIAPRTPTEEKLASIWAELLAYQPVGVDDDLFERGGNSLSATQILSRISDLFSVEIPLRALFAPENNRVTVETLARMIEEAQLEQVDATDLSSILEMVNGMSEEEIEKYLNDGNDPTQNEMPVL